MTARTSPGSKRMREQGWAVVDTGGTYQTKFFPNRSEARYDVEHAAHIMDGHFVIRRAVLTWTSPKPKPSQKRKGKR